MTIEITTKDEALQPDYAELQSYLNYVQKRRSIRKLKNGPVSDETIRSIVEAGRWSPSSGNSQPTRIVVVKERHAELWDFIENTLKQKLQGDQLQRALSRLPGYRSGAFTLVFYEDSVVADKAPFPGGLAVWQNFSAQALGIAQANVWNAITAAGLAASNQHMNMQIEEELREFLNVPTTWRSYSIFPVGYADEVPTEGTRHPHEEIAFYEQGPVA